MNPTEQADRWLADVPRFDLDPMPPIGTMDQEVSGEWVRYDDALAAIARHLAPDDDLVERLLRVQWSVTGEPCANGNVDETCAHEAAARISALTAHNADLAAQNRDATKAIARMRARLARMEGGPMDDDAPAAIIGEIGNQIHNLSCELHGNDEVADRLSGLAGRLWNAAKQLPARAALTDGGSNG